MSKRGDAIWVAVSGLAVGWIAGLSVSPVVHVVIEGVFGVLVSVLTVLSGVKPAAKQPDGASAQNANLLGQVEVSVTPIAVFSLFLALGASLGVLARTNQLLGLYPSFYARRWQTSGVIEPKFKAALQQAVTQSLNPADQKGAKGEERSASSPLTDGLFSGAIDENVCPQIRIKEGEEWIGFVKQHLPKVQWPIVESCVSQDCQAAMKEQLCPAGK